MKIYKILLFTFFPSWFIPLAAADTAQLEKQRQVYQHAKKALQTNQIVQYRQLQDQLEGYPLQGYLDYLYLEHRLSQVPAADIEAFLAKNQDTFYGQRLRIAWLNRLAQQKQWQKYLQHYQAPYTDERRCYHAQALIQTGQHDAAKEAFEALWLVGRSQPNSCDPVFSYAQKRGLISDELLWERLMLALREQQFQLARFLARSVDASATATAWIDRWEGIHNSPEKWLSQLPVQTDTDLVSLALDVPLAREIIVHGLLRLGRQAPDKAFGHWQRLKDSYAFTTDQRHAVQRQMGLWAALNRDDMALTYFADTPNEPWRVRAALWQQDWPAVKQAIASLDDTMRQENRWQYWLARSLAETGKQLEAEAIWRNLYTQRDYYAHLAADRLGEPYAMNNNPIAPSEAELEELHTLPAYLRLREFAALNEDLEVRRETFYAQQNLDSRQLQLLSLETFKWGWYHQTIAILGSARYWDALEQRFPVIYDTEMRQASRNVGVDASWLFAIARQESAFHVNARSHAGAMGLMQVMPETGRATAKQMNKPLQNVNDLYSPGRNIEIGSFYLRRMQDRLQNNPVLATAAYNAGPHRVNRWLPEREMPADIWIENIPFNETRRYLRSVMSYAAIYDYQREQPIKPLSERMPAVKPK